MGPCHLCSGSQLAGGNDGLRSQSLSLLGAVGALASSRRPWGRGILTCVRDTGQSVISHTSAARRMG